MATSCAVAVSSPASCPAATSRALHSSASPETAPKAAALRSASTFRGTALHSSASSPSTRVKNPAQRWGGIRCSAQSDAKPEASGRIIKGKCFVVRDNIDTDQIIPAEFLTLVPSKPDEYEKLGSYAMYGLPDNYPRYIVEGNMKTEFPIIVGGANFGCGSSREHAPVALGASGCRAVVAESYARIFFRNSVATGELYPVETEQRLCDLIQTGDEITVDLEHDLLIHHPTGNQFPLKPIGEAGPVIDAGGIFNYARSTGMIAAPNA